MRPHSGGLAPGWVMLAGAGFFVLAVPNAYGQHRLFHPARPDCCPPAYSTAPGTETFPPGTVAPVPEAAPPPLAGGEAFAGRTAFTSHDAGYIDGAVPMNLLRLRVDAAYNNTRPDRAEFFYPKCGCFRTDPGPLNDPNAPGPRLLESAVNYQEISAYLEVAPVRWFSAFLDVPVRFLNPDVNANTAGLSDINAGVKVALLAYDDLFVTLQFRTYAPTGDGDRGLGTDHVSLEPALLIFHRLTDRLSMEAELRDWIPINGTDFAGNVIRYGLGASYAVLDTGRLRVSPVAEVVGWTVLDGKVTVPSPDLTSLTVQDAEGDTIVNVKVGVRVLFGNADIYTGYGRALTGDTWYEDIYRLEFRLHF